MADSRSEALAEAVAESVADSKLDPKVDSGTAVEMVCVGAIAGGHGLAGVVKIKPFTAQPEDVVAYGAVADEAGTRSFDIKLVGENKGTVLARMSGVGDRTAADALKGVRLYVPRTALPEPDEGEFYHADLVGLSVIDQGGETLGKVHAMHDFGAGDLLEMQLEDGRLVMLPFTQDCVPTVDLKAGHVVAVPTPGLLDDGNEEEGERDV
jgi:16S rRNA processing protein RimM